MVTRTHCNYYRDDHIHYFQFNQMSYQAVDEWVEIMQAIIQEEGDLHALVFDITRSAPPFRYFIDQLRAFQRQTFLPQEVRTVFLYETGTGLLSSFRILMTSATVMSNFSIRFFPSDATEQAYAWLNH